MALLRRFNHRDQCLLKHVADLIEVKVLVTAAVNVFPQLRSAAMSNEIMVITAITAAFIISADTLLWRRFLQAQKEPFQVPLSLQQTERASLPTVRLQQSEMRNMTSMMRRLTAIVIGLSLSAVVMLGASVADAADAANGERLARRWCASCHVVASDQRGATSEAPPFATVAARPDFEAAKIARFLLEPHPKMPNMALSRSEAGDLAAYIGSLR